jgi:hypothetical protein
MKHKIVCSHCGSENIKRDAWATWNVDTQEWDLDDVFDSCFCEDCTSTSNDLIKRVPIDGQTPDPS